jgi:hypothetical protein
MTWSSPIVRIGFDRTTIQRDLNVVPPIQRVRTL